MARGETHAEGSQASDAAFSLSFSQVTNIMSSFLRHAVAFQGILTNHLERKLSGTAKPPCLTCSYQAQGIVGTFFDKIMKTPDGESPQ